MPSWRLVRGEKGEEPYRTSFILLVVPCFAPREGLPTPIEALCSEKGYVYVRITRTRLYINQISPDKGMLSR
jgi:hypothetical protein